MIVAPHLHQRGCSQDFSLVPVSKQHLEGPGCAGDDVMLTVMIMILVQHFVAVMVISQAWCQRTVTWGLTVGVDLSEG